MEQQQRESSFLTGSPAPTQDEKTIAMLTHILGIVGPILVPLFIMVTRGKESAWVNNQAKEALNFQVVCVIGYLLSSPLTLCLGLGYVMALGVLAVAAVLGLLAGLKANGGAMYKYPLSVPVAK